MNKIIMVGLVAGAVVVTAGGTFAGYKMLKEQNAGPTQADVLAVEPLTRDIKKPHEVCRDVVETHQAPVKDENRVAGTAIGAVVGGLILNQAVKGDSRKLATIGGAAAGGYAGNQVQKKMQGDDVVTETRQVCENVTDVETIVIGYRVKYRLGDHIDTVDMDHDPGNSIQVEGGELVLTKRPVTGG